MIAAAARPSSSGAFRGEVLKVSRQRSTWLMLLGAFVLLGVIVLASSSAGKLRADLRGDPSTFVDDMVQIYGTVFQVGSGIFLLLVGARLLGMEYSSGTIRVLYARGVGRLQLLVVKLLSMLVLGLLLLAGYVLLVAVIVATTVQAWSGGLAPLGQVSAAEWQNVARAIGFYTANIGVVILVAAAAAAIGRSLSFALAAALALFPVDNFGSLICALLARATQHPHPWNDINQWFLGPNLNYLLSLWETTKPRPAFAAPTAPVDLTHVVAVIAAWSLALAAIAVGRTLRPDVLE